MKKNVNIFDKILNPGALFNVTDIFTLEHDGSVSVSLTQLDAHCNAWKLYSFNVLKGEMSAKKYCLDYHTYVRSTFEEEVKGFWYRMQYEQVTEVYNDTLKAISKFVEKRTKDPEQEYGDDGMTELESYLRETFCKRCEELLLWLKAFKDFKASLAAQNLVRAEMGLPLESYPEATRQAYDRLTPVLEVCRSYGYRAGDNSATMKLVRSGLQEVVNTLWDDEDKAKYHWNVNAAMAQAVVSFLYQGEGRDTRGVHTSKFVNLESGKVLSLIVSTLYHALQVKGFVAFKVIKAKQVKPDDCPTTGVSVGEAD